MSRVLMYKGEVIDLSYTHHPEPNDFESPLIRRCVMGLEVGADESAILQICMDEGQSPLHARLTYQAALLLFQDKHKGG